MNQPIISAIAAIGQNRELGKGNDLLWRIPADLQRVKELTTGNVIIMGRKTYESIGRPLPNRLNIVISRNPDYQADGCVVVTSLEAALTAARAANPNEIFIFGGAGIYALAMPHVTHLYLTQIDAADETADVFFPNYANDFAVQKEYPEATHDGLRYQWVDLHRI